MPPSSGITDLPQEILESIFLATWNNRCEPEDLLPVCKQWLDTALGIRHLWARIRVTPHIKGKEACLGYVQTRLDRAGPKQLLDVHFTHVDDHNPYLQELVLALTGPNGEVAARWRLFSYTTLGSPQGETKIKRKLFIFHTPSLEELFLSDVKLRKMFPRCPNLRRVELRNCTPICIVKTKDVRELVLFSEAKGTPVDLHPLSSARKLTVLDITARRVIIFPQRCNLSSLRELSYNGPLSANTFNHVVAPNIIRLNLLISNGVEHFANCPDVQFDKVQYLQIGKGYHPVEDWNAYRNGVWSMLANMPELQTLRFHDRVVAGQVIARRYQDPFPRPISSATLMLEYNDVRIVLGNGPDRKASVECLLHRTKVLLLDLGRVGIWVLGSNEHGSISSNVSEINVSQYLPNKHGSISYWSVSIERWDECATVPQTCRRSTYEDSATGNASTKRRQDDVVNAWNRIEIYISNNGSICVIIEQLSATNRLRVPSPFTGAHDR